MRVVTSSQGNRRSSEVKVEIGTRRTRPTGGESVRRLHGAQGSGTQVQPPVPSANLRPWEFLLGRYCATTDEEEIAEGLAIVERQLADRTVRTGEEELFKARARELGAIKLIDVVKAKLDARTDSLVAGASQSRDQGRPHR